MLVGGLSERSQRRIDFRAQSIRFLIHFGLTGLDLGREFSKLVHFWRLCLADCTIKELIKLG